MHELSPKAVNEFVTSLTNEIRIRIAALINSEPEEIIFHRYTTEVLLQKTK